jgi:hypothetical protein
MFSSTTEGFKSYRTQAPKSLTNVVKIAIDFEYFGDTPATSTPERWTDYAFTELIDGRCLVNDIEFSAMRPGNNRLSKRLQEIGSYK